MFVFQINFFPMSLCDAIVVYTYYNRAVFMQSHEIQPCHMCTTLYIWYTGHKRYPAEHKIGMSFFSPLFVRFDMFILSLYTFCHHTLSLFLVFPILYYWIYKLSTMMSPSFNYSIFAIIIVGHNFFQYASTKLVLSCAAFLNYLYIY